MDRAVVSVYIIHIYTYVHVYIYTYTYIDVMYTPVRVRASAGASLGVKRLLHRPMQRLPPLFRKRCLVFVADDKVIGSIRLLY